MTGSEFDPHCRKVKADGYTVLPAVLTSEECDAATMELDRLEKERDRGGLECVFNKARVFERAYQVPSVLRLVRHFLGGDAVLCAVHGSRAATRSNRSKSRRTPRNRPTSWKRNGDRRSCFTPTSGTEARKTEARKGAIAMIAPWRRNWSRGPYELSAWWSRRFSNGQEQKGGGFSDSMPCSRTSNTGSGIARPGGRSRSSAS